MERIKGLSAYQKGILAVLAAMILVFGVIYAFVTARVGYLYEDAILIPGVEDGNTVYSGSVKGKECRFTVTSDKTVAFRCGEKFYGPYTVREDPSAIPEDEAMHDLMTGIEIREGEKIFFRGGVLDTGSYRMLVNEDGTDAGFIVYAVMADGTEIGCDGAVIDPMKPSAADILELLEGPELTRKGNWTAWFMGIFISAVMAVSILFADEIFRWNLAFQIRDVEYAEPSDWEIAGRSIGWTCMTIAVFVLYIKGLQ